MANQYKIDFLKRTIKSKERYLGTSIWKAFLVILAVTIVIVAGFEIALQYKREVDITAMSIISKIYGQVLLQSVFFTIIVWYFGQQELKRMRGELKDAENE